MVIESSPYLEHIRFEGKSGSNPRLRQGLSIPGSHAKFNALPGIEREPPDPVIPLILKLAGLPVDAYRIAPLQRRLSACLRTLKAGSFQAARQILAQNPELLPNAVSSLLIGVSEFFRDRDVFNALQKIITEDFAARQERIHVWSAGCSNGAELYSVAILLAEAGMLNRSFMVGTDCRQDAIQEAGSGIYRSCCVQQVTAPLLQKYFEAFEGRWRVARQLRWNIQWKVRNLLESLESGPWDIILWRNVAIYLEPASAEAVWKSLAKALSPGGILIVGKAERLPPSLGLSCISRSIYRSNPNNSRNRIALKRRIETAE